MITQTKESQESITPQRALDMLKEGNARFVSGQTISRDLLQQADQTSTGQFPFATVLSCIDSRVSSELIMDQGIGDIFSVRIAGNISNSDILGSMEFATKLAGTKLVLVLGHSACGAVKGAIANAEMGNLTGLLNKIKPAIERAKADGVAEDDFLSQVVKRNVEQTVKEVRANSEVMRELEAEGKIMIVGAVHDLKSGRIEFFD